MKINNVKIFLVKTKILLYMLNTRGG